MFSRIINSSKVQLSFMGLVAAVLVAAGNGSLDDRQAQQIIDAFLTYVLPTLLVAIAGEDVAAKFRGAATQLKPGSQKSPEGGNHG